jgi:CO/xanthine dehydrogenase Mo-binding subunit
VRNELIGSNVRRIDAPSKVTGKLRYAGDMVMPHMLHVQVLRSPHAHARIVSIDTSQAEALEGVEAVITSPTCRARTASACSSTTSRSWRAARCAMSARRWPPWRPRT